VSLTLLLHVDLAAQPPVTYRTAVPSAIYEAHMMATHKTEFVQKRAAAREERDASQAQLDAANEQLEAIGSQFSSMIHEVCPWRIDSVRMCVHAQLTLLNDLVTTEQHWGQSAHIISEYQNTS
jgi:hypothetical protein